MTDDFPTRRAEMEARLSKATAGPWTNGDPARHEGHMCRILGPLHKTDGDIGVRHQLGATWSPEHIVSYVGLSRETCYHNAELIAHAPTDLRACLDAYDAMRGRAEGAERKVDAVKAAILDFEAMDCGAGEALAQIRRALTEETK
jgi:hypothetical protein